MDTIIMYSFKDHSKSKTEDTNKSFDKSSYE